MWSGQMMLHYLLLEITARWASGITKATKVRELSATVPVTCQQPSLGKVTPLAWKPMSP
jgi:hypothetical protein